MERTRSVGFCVRQEEEEENLYDEVSREAGSNLISIKVPKGKKRKVLAIGSDGVITNKPPVTAICRDQYGNKCNETCTNLHITPGGNESTEGMILLKFNREIIEKNGQKNSVKLELMTPKSYVPLANPTKYPRPPIIIPKSLGRTTGGRCAKEKLDKLPLAYCSDNPKCAGRKCTCMMK